MWRKKQQKQPLDSTCYKIEYTNGLGFIVLYKLFALFRSLEFIVLIMMISIGLSAVSCCPIDTGSFHFLEALGYILGICNGIISFVSFYVIQWGSYKDEFELSYKRI